MKILTFGTSNSKNSINKKLAFYAAQQIHNADISLIDINDFEMPIYSEDREKKSGIPQLAHDFYNAIGEANSIVMSFAEYNGSYTSAYKNLFDWTSRIDRKIFQNKPVLMLSTSPGSKGAQSVLAAAKASAPFFAANVIAAISLPNFYDNVDAKTGVVTNETFNQSLFEAIDKL
ncbi:NADPH-dependent oxidoreductase [Marinomonas rhizomae]|uniref:NAD(P)H-dependent FMN reductase n=1 Tax=Marinomonas rhizomae TaxID=491948 RepID=A0A366J0U5_9GAMM|nr:NADPH-dependent FMN reductase [Marinomonas rhizomae]RBP80562.1 NAD(P)H-dependent FMN reductase [Marinomonas rhizomae]RNF71795.1 NADPH-dependent oxidoreductase [Marinomonas rhizomae]